MANQKMDALLADASLMLTNGKADDLQAVLAPVGYDLDKLAEGDALVTHLRTAYQQQAVEKAEAKAATQALKTLRKTARATFQRHVEWAREAFADDPVRRVAYGTEGRRPRALPAWLSQARLFYDQLLADPEAVAKMATVNIDEDELQAAKAEIEAVDAARMAQAKEGGESQTATRVRDTAFDALDQYHRRYRRFATKACAPHPELQEKLGLLQRS